MAASLTAMKSAYELAMERLSKSAPSQTLTAAQKAEIAEIDSLCTSKVAQAELAFRDELTAAESAGDFAKAEELRQRFAYDKAKIEEEREAKKQRVRDGR